MIYKHRTEPYELTILKLLHHRMNLDKNDQLHYFNLKKGFEGEQLFDAYTQQLQCDAIILNDLLLNFNNQTFQIDSLLITSNMIYLLEIKNYFGNFYYKNDRLYQKNDTEVSNPLNQLQRTELLLRQLIQTLGFSIPIQPQVIFINQSFTMYLAPLDKPFIFPTQLKSFFQQLNSERTKLTMQQQKLAEKLSSLHMHTHPNQSLPTYELHQLQKGMSCGDCQSLTITIKSKQSICSSCGQKEALDSAIIRNINEYQLLFPNEKITIKSMMDWCQMIVSPKQIRRILNKHFQKKSDSRWTYYE